MPPRRWPIELYEDERGSVPVRDFIDALPKKRRAKLLAIVAFLADKGPTLTFPYSSQVRGKLRELRTHYGKDHYRILYAATPGRGFVLLHAVVKRSAALAAQDIRRAEERLHRWGTLRAKPRRSP